MNSFSIRHSLRLVVFFVVVFGLAACGGAPTTEAIDQDLVMYLSASGDVNPDMEGRPSPIVVRVLELSTDEEFNRADYSSLTNDAGAGLGGVVLKSMEIVLTPGSTKTSTLELNERTTYLGFVAGYRDIDHSRWRLALSVAPGKTQSISVNLEKQNISVNNVNQ